MGTCWISRKAGREGAEFTLTARTYIQTYAAEFYRRGILLEGNMLQNSIGGEFWLPTFGRNPSGRVASTTHCHNPPSIMPNSCLHSRKIEGSGSGERRSADRKDAAKAAFNLIFKYTSVQRTITDIHGHVSVPLNLESCF